MKKLIFLFFLLFTFTAFSQYTYLTNGDSIYSKPSHMIGYRIINFQIIDSSDTIVDTLLCETRISGTTTWFDISVIDISGTTITTGDIIPGDGNGVTYKINMEYPGDLRLRRTNVTSRVQRTAVIFMGGK